MREQDRPAVVLIERKPSDGDVMREARTWSVAEAAPLVLVHVAPLESNATPPPSRWQRPFEPWQRILGLEATVRHDLHLMARDWVGPATPVDVVVRFGDPVTELAAVAEARGARLVVARSQPARWPLGQGRDGRLRWAVNGPLLLVRAAREPRWAERLYPMPVAARWRL
jgi:nucleotide-binding universal stress UspA family protein